MDSAGTRGAVARVLDASLDDLGVPDSAPALRTSQSADWRLPEAAKLALSTYGLPPARGDDFLGIKGDLQPSVRAEPWSDGRRFYKLGSYGVSRLVAVEDVGNVLALPGFAEMHPALAHRYPSGLQPVPVNSTIALLVECAWRWHWLLPLLVEEQVRAGEAEKLAFKAGRSPDTPDPYAGYQELCRYVLRRFKAIDPGVQDDSGFWPGVIIDVW